MGLISPATLSHIHAPAPPGMNADPILTLPNSGGTSGSINVLDAPLSQTNIDHILSGLAYVNIHSNTFVNCEIRGQIVPEPGGLVLCLLAAAFVRRRRMAICEYA